MPRTLKKSQKTDSRKQQLMVRGFTLVSTLLVVGSLWGWWHMVRSDPTRVFNGAIKNALQTQSYSRVTAQTTNGQNFIQKVNIATEPKQIGSGVNEITQAGSDGFDVLTDIFGTPSLDFVRYTSIKTGQKTTSGKTPDYKAVIGEWGKSTSTDGQTNGQLYNQSVLGVVPIANLPLSKRMELIDFIQQKKVYVADYKNVGRSSKGRPTYLYDVTVTPEAYITMLKKYATMVGMNQLDKTNPADYRSTQALKFQFEVDVWTRQIKTVVYENARKETYGSYGAKGLNTAEPKKSISIDALQQKIQAASE